jgi:hypothetical protein
MWHWFTIVLVLALGAQMAAAEVKQIIFSKERAEISVGEPYEFALEGNGMTILVHGPTVPEAQLRFSFLLLSDPLYGDKRKIEEMVCQTAHEQGTDCLVLAKTEETFFYGLANSQLLNGETWLVMNGMLTARDGVFTYTLQFPERRLTDPQYWDLPLDMLTHFLEQIRRVN